MKYLIGGGVLALALLGCTPAPAPHAEKTNYLLDDPPVVSDEAPTTQHIGGLGMSYTGKVGIDMGGMVLHAGGVSPGFGF